MDRVLKRGPSRPNVEYRDGGSSTETDRTLGEGSEHGQRRGGRRSIWATEVHRGSFDRDGGVPGAPDGEAPPGRGRTRLREDGDRAHPGALGRPEAALPVPLHRLPEPGERDHYLETQSPRAWRAIRRRNRGLRPAGPRAGRLRETTGHLGDVGVGIRPNDPWNCEARS